MSIVEISGGPVTHRYLMNKSKPDIASLAMDLLRVAEKRATRIAELEAERDRYKARSDNHAETLRGIARMPVGDGERMQQWARESLGGYTMPLEATLLALSDECNALRFERDKARADYRRDGYRELGQRLNAAESDRDRLQRECEGLRDLADKVIAYSAASIRFVEHGLMDDAHDADKLMAEVRSHPALSPVEPSQASRSVCEIAQVAHLPADSACCEDCPPGECALLSPAEPQEPLSREDGGVK